MPRYYCDDSPSVRKQHNAGYKHKANVRSYYQQFEAQQNQSLIDQKIKEHLGQSAYQVSTQSAYQISASYNALRPRLPVLPTSLTPMPGTAQFPMNSPLGPGVRPPIFPRPLPGSIVVLRTDHYLPFFCDFSHLSESSTMQGTNIRSYYQQFEAQQNQSLIDQKIKEHLGQSAYQVSTQSAYQISASYNALRPRLPVLPTPLMPMPGTAQFPMNSPLGPGVRPPIFPRPLPVYAPAPDMQPMMAPSGATPMPGQYNSLPRPPTMSGPAAVPGSPMVPPIASGATSMVTPVNSRASSLPTTSGGFDSFNMGALSPEANH